jgi:hypothetical protein
MGNGVESLPKRWRIRRGYLPAPATGLLGASFQLD